MCAMMTVWMAIVVNDDSGHHCLHSIYFAHIDIYIYIVGVRKNKLRYASAHTHIVESLRFAH